MIHASVVDLGMLLDSSNLCRTSRSSILSQGASCQHPSIIVARTLGHSSGSMMGRLPSSKNRWMSASVMEANGSRLCTIVYRIIPSENTSDIFDSLPCITSGAWKPSVPLPSAVTDLRGPPTTSSSSSPLHTGDNPKSANLMVPLGEI
eukprot:TRINITY_DN4319_c0_g1_i4.p1 TRINITY_DN4319_c0_g1~~TRINITY_DN4319_c0_g1_i4.p1  ORF type:complete len:148 (-),score=11.28 TRINITY_DN4319_c0_g1_i4:200-643(-)